MADALCTDDASMREPLVDPVDGNAQPVSRFWTGEKGLCHTSTLVGDLVRKGTYLCGGCPSSLWWVEVRRLTPQVGSLDRAIVWRRGKR